MSAESSPIASPAASELVVAYATPAKAQRRRSNATAGRTQHVLKFSPGRATTIRLPSPSAVKVSITGPRPEDNDSDDNTEDVAADDSQVTVSDMDSADEATKSLAEPTSKITVTVLKGDDIDPKGARLTFLGPISEDEVTVPVEKKKAVPEPLPLSEPVLARPSRVPKGSVMSLPALCNGPPTPLEPVFPRVPARPMQLYQREPAELEEADVSTRRDSVDSETSSTGYSADYERDNEVDDPDASFTQPEQEQKEEEEVKDKYDFLPPPRRNSLFQGRRLPRPSLYSQPDEPEEYYVERPSNPVADAYSSDEDEDEYEEDAFADLNDIMPVPYLRSGPRYMSDSDLDDEEEEEANSYPNLVPLFSATPSRAPSPVVQLLEQVVSEWARGTKRGREEDLERDDEDVDVDVDEFVHVAKKPKLMAVYAL